MDSFIRKCQRWGNLVQIGPMCKVLKPLQLPDGTVLPVRTLLALNAQDCAFRNSGVEIPMNSMVFGSKEFACSTATSTSFRWVNDEFTHSAYISFMNTHFLGQAAAPSANHVALGYGTQSCPGRFFAIQEIKVVVGHIILNYDFKLKSSSVQSSVTRPVGELSVTDPTIESLFKRRS